MTGRRERHTASVPIDLSADLVADAAALLQSSGQSTSVTMAAVDRMNHGLGTRLELVPSWSAVSLIDRSKPASAVRVVTAAPTGIQMRAVTALMSTIDKLAHRGAGALELAEALDTAKRARPAGIWLFLLACATGAGSLAIIFGAHDGHAVFLAAFSAVVGGVIRRTLGRLHVGPLGQVFAAAFVAGVIGGLAVHAGDSSALRLVAVCPAMILVPGPHILNGVLDLLALRIPLGFARLGYAVLILLAIGTGLALGLAVLGTSLPTEPPGRTVPLWIDVLAAAVAAASYPVYFSMPYRMIWWPVLVGAIAHGLRWWVMTVWGWNIVGGAFVACLFVGVALAPIARRFHIPFAGIGFAAVVSLVPGVYVFRMIDAVAAFPLGGSEEELLGGVSDGMTAVLVIIAMAVGLAIPMHVYRDRRISR